MACIKAYQPNTITTLELPLTLIVLLLRFCVVPLRFWFKPHGQVHELRALGSGTFLVRMSSVPEATAAKAALDGKPVMKGSPLVVQYWHDT